MIVTSKNEKIDSRPVVSYDHLQTSVCFPILMGEVFLAWERSLAREICLVGIWDWSVGCLNITADVNACC